MATGDSAGAARAVANTVGLDPEHVHASLLPADKLQKVFPPCCPVELPCRTVIRFTIESC